MNEQVLHRSPQRSQHRMLAAALAAGVALVASAVWRVIATSRGQRTPDRLWLIPAVLLLWFAHTSFKHWTTAVTTRRVLWSTGAWALVGALVLSTVWLSRPTYADGEVRVVDAVTGRARWNGRAHMSQVTDLYVTTAGRLFLLGNRRGTPTAVLLDGRTGRLIREQRGIGPEVWPGGADGSATIELAHRDQRLGTVEVKSEQPGATHARSLRQATVIARRPDGVVQWTAPITVGRHQFSDGVLAGYWADRVVVFIPGDVPVVHD